MALTRLGNPSWREWEGQLGTRRWLAITGAQRATLDAVPNKPSELAGGQLIAPQVIAGKGLPVGFQLLCRVLRSSWTMAHLGACPGGEEAHKQGRVLRQVLQVLAHAMWA